MITCDSRWLGVSRRCHGSLKIGVDFAKFVVWRRGSGDEINGTPGCIPCIILNFTNLAKRKVKRNQKKEKKKGE